ncbi:MAG: putative ABC transport system ATP-binding protein [Myxococcota bacterium]|jgi:putative ABC transport system ATP-binding protein
MGWIRSRVCLGSCLSTLASRLKGDPMSIVVLEDVYKDYALGKTTVHALRGIDLTLEQGEFAVIAGPSGSGKTTALNMIGCVDTATRGRVLVAGQDTGRLSDRALTTLRAEKLGFIFQTFNLISVLNVDQNVEFPLLLRKDVSKKERQARVDMLIEKVGLAPFRKHRPGELSGGQRQRVAIARALVTRPEIVLADEPTANLDSETGETILDLMREINRADKTTFLFSTHDPQVMSYADRVIRLVDGKVQNANASPEQAVAPQVSPAEMAAL